MPPLEPTDFTVFYSWQSDLPDETNRKAIRSALRVASTKAEIKAPQFRILLDEATRGEPGSPNIPATILAKITSCDVFVCDITTINSTSEARLRRTPNPNVLFELGYAVAHLGWQRIIMLFNDEFGSVSHVPFDIDRHRISRYKLAPADPNNKGNHGQLAAKLYEAVLSVAEKDPNRPLGGHYLNPEQVRRRRDISNLERILRSVHFPTLDQMIADLPDILKSRVFYFWEGFNGIIGDSRFHLYDSEALEAIKSIHNAWETCVSHGEQYHMATNSDNYVFSHSGDDPFTKHQANAWKVIDSARANLKKSQANLLALIRDRYLEIDIDATNASAWREYVEFEREQNLKFEREEA